MKQVPEVDLGNIHSILEATRTVAWVLNKSQLLTDGIPPARLRHLGIALLYAAEGDLGKTKDAIDAAVRTE
jgi:hypothetical protein